MMDRCMDIADKSGGLCLWYSCEYFMKFLALEEKKDYTLTMFE